MRTSRHSPPSSTRRPRMTRPRSTRCAGRRRPIRARPASSSRPTGVRSVPPRSAGSTSTRRTSTRSGRRSTCSPTPAARGSVRRCWRPSRSVPWPPARSPSTSRCRMAGPTASTSSSTAGSANTSATRPSTSSSPGLAPPAVDLPAGVSLTTLAERPELIEGVHAVAIEAFADIPGGDAPMAAGDLEEFREAGRGSAIDPARRVLHRHRGRHRSRASATPACCSSRRTGAGSRGTT